MPRTVYKITGTSATKPADLPEGFTVEEATEKVHTVITTDLDREITVQEDDLGIWLDVNATDTHDSVSTSLRRVYATALRDALSAALGDSVPVAPKLRAFIDCDRDKWFEVAPDKFRIASTRAEAERRHRDDPNCGDTYAQIGAYAPLTAIAE